MKTPSFSIIIPTTGRPSLAKSLESIRSQYGLTENDEVIIVADGLSAYDRCVKNPSLTEGLKAIVTRTEPTACFGNTQRNFGMALARGDYLLFLDDDDTYLPYAFHTIRGDLAGCTKPELSLHLFRIEWSPDKILWASTEVSQGNVSTQMIVAPNNPDRLGKWTERYEGDFDFITSTMFFPKFHLAVIARRNG